MSQTSKTVYECPSVLLIDVSPIKVLCESTTEAYDPIDFGDFENGWE